jgi:hypothetical protein
MGILVKMIDSFGVERRRAPFDAVYLVTLRQKKFRQIRAILSRDPGYERFFHSVPRIVRSLTPDLSSLSEEKSLP